MAAFLVRHPEFRVVRPAVAFPAGMTVGEHGALSVPTRTGLDGFFPVSYTHLDVYKRQMLTSLCWPPV